MMQTRHGTWLRMALYGTHTEKWRSKRGEGRKVLLSHAARMAPCTHVDPATVARLHIRTRVRATNRRARSTTNERTARRLCGTNRHSEQLPLVPIRAGLVQNCKSQHAAASLCCAEDRFAHHGHIARRISHVGIDLLRQARTATLAFHPHDAHLLVAGEVC